MGDCFYSGKLVLSSVERSASGHSAWCQPCDRFVRITSYGEYFTHQEPGSLPLMLPAPVLNVEDGGIHSELGMAIAEHLRANSRDGVSLVTWMVVARQFGCTHEWVRQIAVKLNIRAKTQAPKPEKPKRKLKTLTLTCSWCDKDFVLSGLKRSSWLESRRKHPEIKRTACPECWAAAKQRRAAMRATP